MKNFIKSILISLIMGSFIINAMDNNDDYNLDAAIAASLATMYLDEEAKTAASFGMLPDEYRRPLNLQQQVFQQLPKSVQKQNEDLARERQAQENSRREAEKRRQEEASAKLIRKIQEEDASLKLIHDLQTHRDPSQYAQQNLVPIKNINYLGKIWSYMYVNGQHQLSYQHQNGGSSSKGEFNIPGLRPFITQDDFDAYINTPQGSNLALFFQDIS